MKFYFIRKNIFLIILAFISLIPFFWFANNVLIMLSDLSFYLFPKDIFESSFYLWNNLSDFGRASINISNVFPYLLFCLIFEKIGMSISLIEKIIFIIWMTSGSFFTYFLCLFIFKNYDHKKLVGFVAGLFYVLNTYLLMFKWIGFNKSLFAYSAFPLILLIFLKGLQSKDNVRYAIFLGASFLLVSSAINPAYSVAIWGVLIFYLIFFLLSCRHSKELIYRSIIFTTSCLISFLLFNVWYLYPYAVSFLNIEAFQYANSPATFDRNIMNSQDTSFLNIFRLFGHWSFFSKFQEFYYFPYSFIYKSPPFLIISFLIPLLAFMSLLLEKKRIKENLSFILFFILLALIGLFLNKGVHEPLGNINRWLYSNIPLFVLFRAQYDKLGFIIVLSFAILFGFSVSLFYTYLINKLKRLISSIIIIIFLSMFFIFYQFPYWTNQVYTYKENRLLGSPLVSIPNYFFDYINWQKKQEQSFRTMLFPIKFGEKADIRDYEWGYTGTSLLYLNSYKSIVVGSAFSELEDRLMKELSSSGFLDKIMGLWSISYLILENDRSDWKDHSGLFNLIEAKKILAYQQNIDLVEKFGNLWLYRVETPYFLPHFYIPQNIIYSNGDIENLANIFNLEEYKVRSGIYLKNVDRLNEFKINELKERVDEIFIKGELRDRVSEEEFGMVIQPREIQLPQVKFKPGSKIYPLALMVEKFNKWKFRKDLVKSFENSLLYSNMRVSEMIVFNISDFKGYILKNYKEEMERAIDILSKMKDLKDKEFISSWVKLKENLWNHQDKLNEIYGDIAIFEDLNQALDRLKSKPDFSNLIYQLDIPQEKKYDIYLKNKNKELTKIGSKDFKEGSQEFVIPLGYIGENLLDNNLRIKDYLSDSTYLISFDYQSSDDGNLFVSEGESGKIAQTILLSTGKEFRHFDMFFKSSAEVSRGDLHLSVSNVENLIVKKIYQPEIILKSSNLQILNPKRQTPKITFMKINPTKYKVTVEGASDSYTLVFSENFNKNWKAYINFKPAVLIPIGNERLVKEDTMINYFNGEIKEVDHKNIFLDRNTFETWGKKPIPEENHLLVNGYANSWYITMEDANKKQDYEIIIEFLPQRFFYIALFISGLTMVGCFGYLFFSLLKKKLFHNTKKL